MLRDLCGVYSSRVSHSTKEYSVFFATTNLSLWNGTRHVAIFET